MVAALASTDDPKIVAQKIIDAWCRLHKRSPEEIPHLFEKNRKSDTLGILVYAIRTRAHLDIIPTAQMLDIHAGSMTAVQARMIRRMSEANTLAHEQLTALVCEAGLQDRAPIDSKNTVRAANRTKRDAEALERLAAENERVIEAIIDTLGGVNREDVVGTSLRTDAVDAQYLWIAILYNVVAEKRNQRIVSEFTGIDVGTIGTAIRKVSKMVTSLGARPFKTKVLRVSCVLKIDPKKLI